MDRWKVMKSELMYWFCCATRPPAMPQVTAATTNAMHLGAVDAHANGRRRDLVGLQRQQRAADAPAEQIAQQQMRRDG
jgi:hypothetical protein